jgi:hypothetical protein
MEAATIISVVSGGLAGAILTWFVTQRRRKVEIAIDLVEYCFSIYDEIANVKALLRGPSLNDPQQQNQVRKVGDWFELVATLCDKRAVDKTLLEEVVVLNEMNMFHNLVRTYMSKGSELNDAWRWWPNLNKLATS